MSKICPKKEKIYFVRFSHLSLLKGANFQEV
uniref:Uncharacterized protein n=1 Tax=Anguilla anguilla TaxID=7936 RepID=A0A0E9RBW1_ANGAN